MRQSVIHDLHIQMGARMAEFGGCSVPLTYGNVLTEHLSVRHTAGVFDMSHQVTLTLTGPDAAGLLQSLSATDMSLLRGEVSCPVILCNNKGGVIDAFTVYPAKDGLHCAISPVNAARTITYLAEGAKADIAAGRPPKRVELHDRTSEFAWFWLHGPLSKEILRSLKAHTSLIYSKPGFCGRFLLGGIPALVSASRYTGERGFDMMVPRISAAEVWTRLLSLNAKGCGLVALEVLRVEAGRRSVGYELNDDSGPVEAGMQNELALEKGEFPGREALLNLGQNPPCRLAGLRSDIAGVFRSGQEVFADGKPAGRITSGTTSPSVNGSVAMAMLKPATGPLTVIYNGKHRTAEPTAIPFVEIKP